MNYEDSLIVKTAWYYYIENMTQQKISEMLGISRMKVIKFLEKARQDGVIQFKISQERSHHLQLEQKIIQKWNLKDAFVVPTPPDDSCPNDTIAKAAAMYINDRITEDTYINIGYGDTLSRVLNHLATMTESPVSAVSLTGGVSYYLPNTFSSTFNAKLYLYPAPLIVSTKELCSAMQKEPSMQSISRMVNLASMTIVSVGGLNEDATVIKNGIFTKNDFLYLSMQGAVGDILSQFIDKDGNPIQTDIEERLLSTPLSTLRTLPNVTGVASGKHKVKAIRACLKGEYLDILITDEETALSLIEEDLD
ncbi:MAG: sugar-binding transcriptional regulator [Lacrimispora sp.]|uniref:sugar-binding transcriptional regulator n=1 Tax=Lacrimispora sp. TaxID=2719234 RepID=UPI0039E398E2